MSMTPPPTKEQQPMNPPNITYETAWVYEGIIGEWARGIGM